MTTNLLLHGRIVYLLGLVAGLLLYGELFGSRAAPGRRRLRVYAERRDRELKFLRSSLTGTRLLQLQVVGTVFVVAGAVALREWLILPAAPFIALFPALRLGQATAARVTQIEAQIESWLGAIANSLKASPSLGEAIASTISLVPNPMSEEVSVLVKEYEFGTAFDVALDNFAARIGSKTLEGTILALKVARTSGGNLPETLENAASALRELARLEGVVRTKTAEGKAQAFVIAAIPVPMVLGLQFLDPNYFDPLAEYFLGNIFIGIAAVLWAAAILSARKILSVDV